MNTCGPAPCAAVLSPLGKNPLSRFPAQQVYLDRAHGESYTSYWKGKGRGLAGK